MNEKNIKLMDDFIKGSIDTDKLNDVGLSVKHYNIEYDNVCVYAVLEDSQLFEKLKDSGADVYEITDKLAETAEMNTLVAWFEFSNDFSDISFEYIFNVD